MSTKKILNTKWLLAVFMLGIFSPAYFDQNATIKILLDCLKVVVWIPIAILYFVDINVHIKKSFNILLFILFGELFVSTLCSDSVSMYGYMANVMNTFAACFLIEEFAIHSPGNGIKVLYFYFSLCVLINTATIFIFPNAMYANNRGLWVCWFLGEDNGGYIYYIIASTIAMIHSHYISKRITVVNCFVWLSAFVFVFHNDIATGIACQVIWSILVLGYQFGWFRKLLKARYVLYAIVGGFVAVVLFRGLIFEPIVSALGRNITLTGRTLLWDRVLERIQERPLLGFGVHTGEEFNQALETNILGAHNWLLMLMFYGGVVAVILFTITVICSYRDAKKYRNSPFYRYIVIGLIVLAVRFLVEAGQLQIMFMMLALLAYTDEFARGLESAQTRRKFVIKGIPRIRFIWRGRI